MCAFWSAPLADALPNSQGLRNAAEDLRSAAQSLSTRAAEVRSTADAITYRVWADSTSAHAKSLLVSLAGELTTGGTSLGQAASALEALAQYVEGQQSRHEDVTTELEQLRGGVGGGDHESLTRLLTLEEEQRSIESGVSMAMSHAASVVRQAASSAGKYQYSGGHHSIWSRVTDFASGVWDGLYDIAKGLVELGILSAKLSPERMLVDPEGYLRDQQEFENSTGQLFDVIRHHPGQFLKTLVDAQELKSDPVHWAGEELPNLLLTLVGLGAAGKGLQGSLAALRISKDAASTAGAAEAASLSPAITPELETHVIDGEWNLRDPSNPRPVGFHWAPNGIPPVGRRFDSIGPSDQNGLYRAQVSFDYGADDWKVKNVPEQTMFPGSWTKEEVFRAIDEAFTNSIPQNNGQSWIGQSRGITIKGYYRPDGLPKTAFPLWGK